MGRDHRFMLYAGKYSDLLAMQLYNRQQIEKFGITRGYFVCCRCKKHGKWPDGFPREFISSRGTYLCSNCFKELSSWKDRKKGGD